MADDLWGAGHEEADGPDADLLGEQSSDLHDMDSINNRLAAAAAEKQRSMPSDGAGADAEEAADVDADEGVDEAALRRFLHRTDQGEPAEPAGEVGRSPAPAVVLSAGEMDAVFQTWKSAAQLSVEACAEVASVSRSCCSDEVHVLHGVLLADPSFLLPCQEVRRKRFAKLLGKSVVPVAARWGHCRRSLGQLDQALPGLDRTFRATG